MPTPEKEMNFTTLVDSIQQINTELASQAARAVNVSLTIRNWCIGAYIHEYELHGKDRAEYGEKLLFELAKELKNVSNCNKRQLYRYIRMYQFYPQIMGTLTPKLSKLIPVDTKEKMGTLSPQLHMPIEKLVNSLSYSHFDLLVNIDDETKRAFYEIECIQGNWSVRELKRQINSLYYERSELSLNKQKLSELANQKTETSTPQLVVRDPYVFEFLGLKSKEVMSEFHLEEELLDKIQEFLCWVRNNRIVF